MIIDGVIMTKSVHLPAGIDTQTGWIYVADQFDNRVLRESVAEVVASGASIGLTTVTPLFTQVANGPVHEGGITKPTNLNPIPGMSFLHGFLQNGTAQPELAQNAEPVYVASNPNVKIADDYFYINQRIEQLRRDKCL